MSFFADRRFILAKNEFLLTLKRPILYVVLIILLYVAFLNGAGGYVNLVQEPGGRDMFLQGFAQIWSTMSSICCILAGFIGISSMAEERWKNRIQILISRPVYRRDILIGKIIGNGALMIALVTFILLFTSLSLIIYYREPFSYFEFFWRLFTYIIIVSLYCILIYSIAVLTDVLCKNYLGSLAIVVTYVYLEWFSSIPQEIFRISAILPKYVYLRIFYPVSGDSMTLFNTGLPFSFWISNAAPYIFLLLLEVCLVIIAGCWAFSKDEV